MKAETAPPKRERKITVSREDFQTGFEGARRGAGVFIDTVFRSNLAKTMEKEYKCKVENWAPMLKLWQDYNTALHGLYLTTASGILGLGSGMVATVLLDDVPIPKEKKKKEKKKKEKEWTLIEPKAKETVKMEETSCESCSS